MHQNLAGYRILFISPLSSLRGREVQFVYNTASPELNATSISRSQPLKLRPYELILQPSSKYTIKRCSATKKLHVHLYVYLSSGACSFFSLVSSASSLSPSCPVPVSVLAESNPWCNTTNKTRLTLKSVKVTNV